MPVCFCVQVQLQLSRRVANCNFGQSLCKTRHPENCKNATTWWQIWQKQAKSLRLAFNTLFGAVVGCKQTPMVQKSHPRVGKMRFFHKCKFQLLQRLQVLLSVAQNVVLATIGFVLQTFATAFCVSFCQ